MWTFVNAAVRGTSHERGDTPCQDDCVVAVVSAAGSDALVAIVSDGAGSAAHAEEGSGIVCETLLASIEEWWNGGGTVESIGPEAVSGWIRATRRTIESRARDRDLMVRDFACTLVAAIAGPESAAFFQIGDGVAVVGSAGAYEVIFWPDAGEYANMTYFTTDDDWHQHLQFAVRPVSPEDIAVMSDGLQRLALHFASRTAHAPFFVPMFDALGQSPPGYACDLERPLVEFLQSDAVNTRTDDDKSLVLATRRNGAADGPS